MLPLWTKFLTINTENEAPKKENNGSKNLKVSNLAFCLSKRDINLV